MKKIKIPFIWALVCLVGIIVPGAVAFAAGDSESVYPKQYTVENLLSDYQYVTHSDLTALGHTVGTVACGGNADISNFGDGATADSYIHNITAIGNYAAGDYFAGDSKYAGYVGLPAYYKTAAGGVSTGGLTQYSGSGEYIDFNSAFADISNESSSLAAASDAETVTQSDISGDQYNGYTLNLAFSGSKNVVIPKDIYDKINYIKLGGITDINDISTNQYTINVVGVSNVSLTFAYISYSDSETSNTKGILYKDGQPFNNSNSLKSVLSGGIESGQMNMNGMKLLWNFPDAATVNSDYSEGHIVAPSANVTLKAGTGNFEGGIIANSIIDQSAEAHFYPYGAVSTTITSSGTSSGSTSSGNTSSSNISAGGALNNGLSSGSSTSSINADGTLTGVSSSDKTENPKTGGTEPRLLLFVMVSMIVAVAAVWALVFKQKQ